MMERLFRGKRVVIGTIVGVVLAGALGYSFFESLRTPVHIPPTPIPTPEGVGGGEGILGTPTPGETAKARSQGAENDIFYPFTGVVYPLVPSPTGDSTWQCVEVPSGGTVFGAATALGESPTVYNDIGEVTVYPITADGPQPSVSFTTKMMPPPLLAEAWPDTVVCGK